MWFSLSAQTAYFLWSLALGAALGALYDAARGIRLLIRVRGAFLVVFDVLFFALCGMITFLFALPFNKGSVRGFILFGEAVGFLAYRLTLGNIMGRFYAFFAEWLRRFVQKIRKFIEKFFDLLLKAIAYIVYNVNVIIYGFGRMIAQKAANRRKNHQKEVSAGHRRYSHKEFEHERKKSQKTAVRGKNKGRKASVRQKRR